MTPVQDTLPGVTPFDGSPAPEPAPVADDERLARAALTRVVEPDDLLVTRLVHDVGAVLVWDALRRDDTTLPPAVRDATRPRVRGTHPEKDLAALAALGGRFLCPGDPEWPTSLADLGVPGETRRDSRGRPRAAQPLGLWVRGPLDLRMTERSVAVIGSRAATGYGGYVARQLGAELAERGWAVVSGGALGIDGAGHEGALSAGGATVAVLACGVDTAYPPANARLLAQIAAEGLVLSEWPPGCSPMRHRFLTRNRVIAALARGVVVVEAAFRSGTLSTVGAARDLGRHIMAVPGPVTSAMSGGCLALIREDGVAVADAAQVIELVGRIGDDLAPAPTSEERPRDTLSSDHQRVLDAVPVRRGVSPDGVAATAGLPLLTVIAALNELCATGWVVRDDRGAVRLAPRSAPARHPSGP